MRRLFISFLVICSISLEAQHPFFYKIDSDVGLPSDEVYEVVQDDFGDMWIGCDAGLFRYDGVKFVRFQNKEQSGRSISHFRKDGQGRIWCQNFSGQVFYVENDSLHLFQDFSDRVRSFPKYDIDSENNVLYLALDSFYVGYNITTKERVFSIQKTPLKGGSFPETNAITCFEGMVFVKFNYQYYLLTPATQTLRLLFSEKSLPQKFYNQGKEVISIITNQNNPNYQFVNIKKEGLHKMNTFSKEALGSFIFMIKTIKGYYAVCTSSGVKLMDKNFQQITQTLLPNEKISDITEDREGNIWLTSLQNGIYVIPSLELEVFPPDFFPKSNITALTQRNGKLVIGTYSGAVIFFDTKTNEITTQKRVKNSSSLAVKDFVTFKKEWYVARGDLVRIDENGQEYKVKAPGNIRSFSIMNDTLFVATPNVVGKVEIDNRETTISEKSGRDITTHPSKNIVYYSTTLGFFEYKNGRSTELFYKNEKIYPTSFAWQGDTLWIGSISEGLYAFKDGAVILHLPHSKKLKGSTIRKLYTYQNQLLISADAGLMMLDFQTQNIKVFDATDGLRQKEINDMEIVDGMVYLGSTRGLVRFPLEMTSANSTPPNITFTKLTVNNEPTDFKENLSLQYRKNNLSFSFRTALMRSRGTFYYQYRLVGLDDTWKETNASTPQANYTSLPSGAFTFEVKAVNEDGFESDVAAFEFVILKPIWEQWWFIVLVLGLVTSLIYWLVQRRIRNIQKRANIENELKTTQLTAIKAQMNPHFLYNALNSIQDLILQKDIRGASRYLTKFSLLMRKVLEASGNIAISLENEIALLRLYLQLERLRFGDDFEFELTLPEERDLETLQIPSMIIQPFVENAVKHGLLHKLEGKKRLHIDFAINGIVVCTIEDNGVGRVHSEKIKARRGIQPKSFATSATQKRLEILNQIHKNKIGLEIIDLYENNEASGTRVVLKVPILK